MKTIQLSALALVLAALTATADTKVGTNVPPITPPAIPAAPATATPAPVTTTIAPPAMPAPAKPAHTTVKKKTSTAKKPVAKKAATKTTTKKPVVKKAAAPAFSTPLQPGAATVAAKHVNVRGKPTIFSEVLARLNEGDSVTVVEEITRDNAKADDPTVWAKINAPSTAHLWVSGQFVDTNKVVTVKKLNIRTGPGENYSVAGSLAKGDTVKDIGSKDGWLEIESSGNNFAYVAAAYLKQEVTTPAGATNDWAQPTPAPTPEPAPTPTPVATETTAIAPTAELTPAPAPATTAAPASAPATTGNELVPAKSARFQPATPTKGADVAKSPKKDYTPKITISPEPRIVSREGIVRRTFSIQAPTSFALASPETGETINYLYTTAKDLNLARYKGMHIIVTGEEGLDERWVNTPIITIQKIQVVE